MVHLIVLDYILYTCFNSTFNCFRLNFILFFNSIFKYFSLNVIPVFNITFHCFIFNILHSFDITSHYIEMIWSRTPSCARTWLKIEKKKVFKN